MNRPTSASKARTEIYAVLSLPALFIAGFNPVHAQSDEQPELHQVVLTQEGSFEIRAGSVTMRAGNTMELSEGVVVTFEDSEMTLSSDTMTIREGEPWEMEGFSISRAAYILTADSGTFNPETKRLTADANAKLTLVAEAR